MSHNKKNKKSKKNKRDRKIVDLNIKSTYYSTKPVITTEKDTFRCMFPSLYRLVDIFMDNEGFHASEIIDFIAWEIINDYFTSRYLPTITEVERLVEKIVTIDYICDVVSVLVPGTGFFQLQVESEEKNKIYDMSSFSHVREELIRFLESGARVPSSFLREVEQFTLKDIVLLVTKDCEITLKKLKSDTVETILNILNS